MYEQGLEDQIDKIDNYKTKLYFQEISSCYYNRNYRACIVQLWSVLICDLLFKLEYLKDISNDSTAISILEKIQALQKKNPSSPDWENKLIEEVKLRTELLQPSDYVNIISLQKNRHLCAHPIIENNSELYTPNKTTTKSFLQNILIGIFTKPPIFTKSILNEILLDIAIQKNVVLSKDDLDRYLESKYFSKTNHIIDESLFKSFWKIVFTVSNVECDENRKVNFHVLNYIYKKRQLDLNTIIKSNVDFFSNTRLGDPSHFLIKFLCMYPNVYTIINDSAKVIIAKQISTSINSLALGWYTFKTSTDHLSRLDEKYDEFKRGDELLTVSNLDLMIRAYINKGDQSNIIRFCITKYVSSKSYKSGNTNYIYFIEPYLEYFNEEEINNLIAGIMNNSQVYNRSSAFEDHSTIVELVKVKFTEIDVDRFEKFLESKESGL